VNRTLIAALVAACSLTAAFADALPSRDATITQVYDHPLPDVPGKSLRGVLVEYGPAAICRLAPMRSRRLSTPPCWKAS